jgi:ubiquinone/menaquinone biosynthesis C-methylase UbiE
MRLPNPLFLMQVARLWATRQTVGAAALREDYDRLSAGYDDHFSKHVRKHSLAMLRRLDLRAGHRVLDLACGTGTLALAAAEAVGPTGEVIGVDRSEGMLAVAERKRRELGLPNVRWIAGDMASAFDRFPGSRFDAITCGWAIGYARPTRLLREAARHLVPGGKVGLIENRRDTLAPVRAAALRVAQTRPADLQCLMDLHARLPLGRGHMGRWLRHAGLAVLATWDGQEPFVFARGADVLDWVLHTGASAGFDRMMRAQARAECDRLFIRYIEEDCLRDGRIAVAHRFVAAVGRSVP